MTWWQLSIVLTSGGMTLFGLACVVYVALKFLSLGISLDQMLSRQLQIMMTQQPLQQQMGTGQQQNLGEQMRAFMASQGQMPQTDGEFIPYSETESAVREEVNNLRKKGMSSEDLEQALRNAVSMEE